jgi:hypothetical protein
VFRFRGNSISPKPASLLTDLRPDDPRPDRAPHDDHRHPNRRRPGSSHCSRLLLASQPLPSLGPWRRNPVMDQCQMLRPCHAARLDEKAPGSSLAQTYPDQTDPDGDRFCTAARSGICPNMGDQKLRKESSWRRRSGCCVGAGDLLRGQYNFCRGCSSYRAEFDKPILLAVQRPAGAAVGRQ